MISHRRQDQYLDDETTSLSPSAFNSAVHNMDRCEQQSMLPHQVLFKNEIRHGSRAQPVRIATVQSYIPMDTDLLKYAIHDAVLWADIISMSFGYGKELFDSCSPPQQVSIGKSLDPFRTMFQSSSPSVSVEELKYHCRCITCQK
jgi:hypothetical protein